MTHEFDEAVAISADGRGDIPERWTMGPGIAHGGYLMSLALAGAMPLSPHPDPVTMSAHFVRRATAGPARVVCEVLKVGRTLSTVGADVLQDGATSVATLTTFGDLGDAGDIAFRSISFPELPEPEACIAADPAENPLVPTMVGNLDLRLTPESVAWAMGENLENARMQGWVGFADGRAIDALSLPMFADALPPPVVSVGLFAPWTPTIELTVHVRRRPATERLAVSFHTDLVGGTYFESTGTLWNADGTLVAMSRQLQLINLT